MSDRPSLDDLQALTERDLSRVVAALLGTTREALPTERPFDLFREEDNAVVGVVVRRVLPGRPALAGIALPSLARAASRLSIQRVIVATTGVLEPEARAHVGQAVDKLQQATGLVIEVLDGQDLLGKIHDSGDVRRLFFPTAEEVPDVAATSGVNAGVVKTAAAVAIREPPSTGRLRLTAMARLAWAVALITAIVAVRIPVNPTEARRVAIIGIAVLLISLASVLAGSLAFGRSVDRFGGPLLEQLIPVPDRTSILRQINVAGGTTVKVLGRTLFVVWLRALRIVFSSGVLGFVAFFGFLYLLVWSYDPAPCRSVVEGCHGAFGGAGMAPSVGDFIYVAAQGAFFNQPAGLGVASHAAKSVVTAEFLCAAVLLVDLAASMGFRRELQSPVALHELEA